MHHSQREYMSQGLHFFSCFETGVEGVANVHEFLEETPLLFNFNLGLSLDSSSYLDGLVGFFRNSYGENDRDENFLEIFY
jgi:hypothetical protein